MRTEAPPEQRLEAALLTAFDHFDEALRLDEQAKVLAPAEAQRIRRRERNETTRVLSELRKLERRHPAPPPSRSLRLSTWPQRRSAPPRMPPRRRGSTISI
jgi:hypothetical protein